MLVQRKKGLATTMVVKSESRERLLTASRQKTIMKYSKNSKQNGTKKRDGKAERGRICELESKMVVHDNCCRGEVTVRGAETGQHVEISFQIVIQAPTKGVN